MADELFDPLNGLASSRSLPAGTILFRRDEASHFVYVVRSGEVALLWPDAEDAAPMEIAGPGSVVGLPAAINGTYSVTAKTEVDSELGVVSAARVVELLETVPGFCRIAMRMMSHEVAKIRSSIAEHCWPIEVQ